MSRNLAIFLAGFASEASEARYKAMSQKDLKDFKEHIVMKFPVIQGTKNQFDIDRIGKMECDYSKLHDEVKELLSEVKK